MICWAAHLGSSSDRQQDGEREVQEVAGGLLAHNAQHQRQRQHRHRVVAQLAEQRRQHLQRALTTLSSKFEVD